MVACFDPRPLDTWQRESQSEPRYSPLAGKLFPNGEFTVGKVPPKRQSEWEQTYDKVWADQYEYAQVPVYDYRGFRIETQVYHNPDKESVQIGLSTLINSHKGGKRKDGKPRNQRGLTGLTSHGKRSIRQACYLASERLGKSRLGFLTLTVPDMRPDFLAVILGEWGELVRQFNQEIDREYERLGVAYPFRLAVTEIQEKRFHRDGIPVPHLHMVYHSHLGDYRWFFPAAWLRSLWQRLVMGRLRSALPDYPLPEIDFRASVDCQAIHKDPARELAKYLSKGSAIRKMVNLGFTSDIPRSWYHLPLFLRQEIKRLTQPCPEWLKTLAMSGSDLVDRGLCEYLFPITRKVPINSDRTPLGPIADQDTGNIDTSVQSDIEDTEDQLFGYAGKLTQKWQKKLCKKRA